MTKQTKWHVRPARTQTSLVRSMVSPVLHADSKADPSLRWAHMSFCWVCHEAAQLVYSGICSDSHTVQVSVMQQLGLDLVFSVWTSFCSYDYLSHGMTKPTK